MSLTTKTLYGWADNVRNLGKLIFISLRRDGVKTQLVIEVSDTELFEKAKTIKNEDVIKVTGNYIVAKENSKQEFKVESLFLLNKSDPLPINTNDLDNLSDEVNLTYRYLVLRNQKEIYGLKIRSKLNAVINSYFNENGFLNVDTPTLTKATPEGARDYLVPSRVHKNNFYALPQSPQMFKQLLMMSGIDKYYQIAKCYRDEDLRADRQPEFNQLDVEMAFVEPGDIFSLTKDFLSKVFKDILNIDLPEVQTITYSDAIKNYGTDKPDLRFDLKINDISELLSLSSHDIFVKNNYSKVCMIQMDTNLSRKEFDTLKEKFTNDDVNISFVKTDEEGNMSGGLAKVDVLAKFTNKNAYYIIGMGTSTRVNIVLGEVRSYLANLKNLFTKPFAPVWVTNWPLFEKIDSGLTSMHHPFTAMTDDTKQYLKSMPEKCMAKAYDIVLNGYEIGGGSIRIHDFEEQKLIFNKLGLSADEIESQFGFFTKALKYGCPPHGGIAIGTERLAMILANKTSIRDVIAFPKTQAAACPLTKAPSLVSDDKYLDLGIKLDLSIKKGN